MELAFLAGQSVPSWQTCLRRSSRRRSSRSWSSMVPRPAASRWRRACCCHSTCERIRCTRVRTRAHPSAVCADTRVPVGSGRSLIRYQTTPRWQSRRSFASRCNPADLSRAATWSFSATPHADSATLYNVYNDQNDVDENRNRTQELMVSASVAGSLAMQQRCVEFLWCCARGGFTVSASSPS